MLVATAVFSLVAIACGLELTSVENGASRDAAAPDAEATDASDDAAPDQCTKDEECDGFGNACYVSAACVTGRCEFQLRAPGAVATAATQVLGDCLRLACDGFGGLTNFVDDTDVQSDSNSCTIDLCVGGTPHPIHPPVSDGTPCGDAGICTSGACGSAPINDAGADAETDSGADAGTDAAPLDAGDDASFDAMPENDAESDAGTDAGP